MRLPMNALNLNCGEGTLISDCEGFTHKKHTHGGPDKDDLWATIILALAKGS